MALDDGGAGAAPAAGSAADILGGAAAGGGDAGAGGAGEQRAGAGGADGGAGAGGDAAAGSGAADPEFYSGLSAEAAGEGETSHRDYVKAKGFKSLDDLAAAYRHAEKAIHDSGRVKIPGADAKPEEVAAFHKAIGVPDDAKGYQVAAPKDADGNDIPLNTDAIGQLAESAHKLGVPKSAFEGLTQEFIKYQLDQAADAEAAERSEAEATVKGWGNEKDVRLANVDKAMRALGLSGADGLALRGALGPAKTLNLLDKIGGGMTEDTLITGGSGRFGVSGAEAQAEADKLKGDAEFQKKVRVPGSPERIRWNRLMDAISAEEERKARAG
jgi:hypothetical protein